MKSITIYRKKRQFNENSIQPTNLHILTIIYYILQNVLSNSFFQIQQVREEESYLRQENLRLKEEILNLKQQVGSSARIAPPNRYAPPVQEQTIPMVYVGIAVILGFIGIVLGKFVL